MPVNSYKNIEFTILDVTPPPGSGPTKVSVDCPTHPDVKLIEVWKASSSWSAGNKLRASVYEKEYQGSIFFSLSKFDEVSVISTSTDPSEAIRQEKPTPTTVEPRTASVPPSVSHYTPSQKDKTIAILAIVKAVIAVGGTQEDADSWIDYVERKVNE
jgi:hypothetical protein